MAENDGRLDVLLVQLRGHRLLIPNACVAEILRWRRLRSRSDTPEWHEGDLSWRSTDLPAVALEYLLPEVGSVLPPNGGDACQLVMHRVRSDARPEFYVLIAQTMPQLMHIAPDGFEEGVAGAGVARMTVQLGPAQVVIPNLEAIEETIENSGILAAV